MPVKETFQETNLISKPIRDLGLTIQGTRLEPIIAEFEDELQRVGIRKLRPHFYLSDEWGVPFGTITLAIPFYLARPDLTAVHAERVGHIEGFNRADILRYLRHEMGHVVNYGYRLYDDQDWVKQFGSITQPYLDDYRPKPFSRRYVRHLPGWYAQKHPDEDWAETFAVWMTPGLNWCEEYASWPTALSKLTYCDRTLAALADREPLCVATDQDEDVGQMTESLEQYYGKLAAEPAEMPAGLDGALRAIFEDLDQPAEKADSVRRQPAGVLIRRLERDLLANVYRWTGHFPERTRILLRHLEQRAGQLQLVYPEGTEVTIAVALTTLVTALAMNYIHRGSYLP
jgi:hypothetical protein